jgi:hypothetical protein
MFVLNLSDLRLFLRVKIGCIKEWCVCLYNQRCHFDTKAVLFKYFVNDLFQLSLKADMILFLTDQKSHNNTKYTDIHMFSPSSVAYEVSDQSNLTKS